VWAASTRSAGQSSSQGGAGQGGQSGSGASDYGTPRAIASGVEVYHVTTADGGGLAAARTASVQVLVPQSELAVVLAALARGDQLSLLPVPGSAG
jgi:hypothetical protein